MQALAFPMGTKTNLARTRYQGSAVPYSVLEQWLQQQLRNFGRGRFRFDIVIEDQTLTESKFSIPK